MLNIKKYKKVVVYVISFIYDVFFFSFMDHSRSML